MTKLYCFTYAGGNNSLYFKWKLESEFNFSICPIKLKGHDYTDIDDYENLTDYVEDALNQIDSSEEFYLFGHSMGALLAYETALRIQSKNLKSIFVSACAPPNISNLSIFKDGMKKDEFLERVYELGGTPKEVFENKDLLNMVYPILRRDFKKVRHYRKQFRWDKLAKVNNPIHIFYGDQDSISQDCINNWKKFTTSYITVDKFSGNHFFIKTNSQEVLGKINEYIG